MTIETNVRVVGHEVKASKKTGELYDVLCFIDGATPVSIMVKRGVTIPAIEPMKKYDLTIDVNLGRYMNATVLAVAEV